MAEETSSTAKPKPAPVSALTPHAPKARTPRPAQPTPEEGDVTRRAFVWHGMAGFLTINVICFARFFFPRTLFEPKTRFTIGYPGDYGFGVDTKWQQKFRIWVVRGASGLFVIYARCTHLGCTPDWKPSENKFKCPCHGSGFDSEGINYEGPAPKPMLRCHLEVDATGQIVVDSLNLYDYEGTKSFKDTQPSTSGPLLAV
jgi:cytochrome b6-f complex iron-sulfur subunit